MPTAVDAMLAGYLECALWSSTDDDGAPLDDVYRVADVAPSCLPEVRAELEDFVNGSSSRDLESIDPGQIGHDFWLTRNRHGAGFWDRGLGARGDRLTRDAHVYGEAAAYVGDDGKVWVTS